MLHTNPQMPDVLGLGQLKQQAEGITCKAEKLGLL